MPIRLPSADDLGGRPSPTSNRPIAVMKASMPDYSAEGRGAQVLAKGVQDLGAGIMSVGSQIADIERKDASFNSKLERSGLDNDITGFLEEKQRDMPADGRGFVETTLPEMDRLAENRFSRMAPDHADRYRRMWQVEREGWRTKLAKVAIEQKDQFQTRSLDDEQTKTLNNILSDPSQGRTLIEQQAQFERDSTLRPEVRAERERKWRQKAQEVLLERTYGNDPEGLRRSFGIPSPAAAPQAGISPMGASALAPASVPIQVVGDSLGVGLQQAASGAASGDAKVSRQPGDTYAIVQASPQAAAPGQPLVISSVSNDPQAGLAGLPAAVQAAKSKGYTPVVLGVGSKFGAEVNGQIKAATEAAGGVFVPLVGAEAGDGVHLTPAGYRATLDAVKAAVPAAAPAQPQRAALPATSPPDIYANISDADEAGRPGQLEKFKRWNPDPIGNHEKLLASVKPQLADVVRKAQADNPGLRFVVGSGARDEAQQRLAVEFGWSTVGPGHSKHNSGEAADLWPLDEKGRVTFDKARLAAVGAAVKKAAAELGVPLQWGGDWKKQDLPHFEVRPGYEKVAPRPQTTPAAAGIAPAQPGTFGVTGPEQVGSGGGIQILRQPSAPVAAAIRNASQRYGISEDLMLRIGWIESRFDPNAQHPGSKATGVFQFIPSTWRQFGQGADPRDPNANADAAARLILANRQTLRNGLGREPTDGELYLAHQQGAGGALKLLQNPNAPVSSVVPASHVTSNGGSLSMTAGQFAQKWTGKFDNTKPAQFGQPSDVDAIPPDRRLAMIQRAEVRQRAEQAEVARAALARGEIYERAILDFAAGRGDLPSREQIENDPALDLKTRNATLKQFDAALGGAVTRVRDEASEGYERQIIDGEAGRGAFPDRDAIAADPRLTSKQRNRLLDDLDKTTKRVTARAAELDEKERSRAASEANERLERGIIELKRGGPAFPRALIESNSFISENQRNTLLSKFDTATKDQAELGLALARLGSGQLDGTGFSKSTHKDVDLIAGSRYPSPATLFSPESDGQEARTFTTELARRTGYVPQAAVEMIRSGFASPDPARVEMAAQFGAQIMAANPNAFATAPGREQIEQNVRAFEHYVSTMAMQPREAATQLALHNDPEWRRKNRRSDDEVKEFEKTLRSSDAVNELRNHLAGFKLGPIEAGVPDLSFTQAGIGEIEADYVLSARLKYAQHGDAELAKKQAKLELLGDPEKGSRGVYGITSVAGRRVLMKYAPEAAPGYPPMPDGSHDYIAAQAVEHIKAVTGKDVGRDRLVLQPLGRNTAEGFRRGLQVPYGLYFFDEAGTLQAVKPNSQVGWVADPRKARSDWGARKKAEADAQVVQDAYGLTPPAAPPPSPAEARRLIAERDRAARAAEAEQAAQRRPLIEAEIERSRAVARDTQSVQIPDEIDREAMDAAAQRWREEGDLERQRMNEAELAKARELARSSRQNRTPVDQ